MKRLSIILTFLVFLTNSCGQDIQSGSSETLSTESKRYSDSVGVPNVDANQGEFDRIERQRFRKALNCDLIDAAGETFSGEFSGIGPDSNTVRISFSVYSLNHDYLSVSNIKIDGVISSQTEDFYFVPCRAEELKRFNIELRSGQTTLYLNAFEHGFENDSLRGSWTKYTVVGDKVNKQRGSWNSKMNK